MLKMLFAPAAAVFALSCVVPVAASAAERQSGMRNSDHINVSAARKQKKKLVRQAATDQIPIQDQPWAGHDTDLAGNSFVYYRTGIGTPFGTGRTLRGHY